MPPPIRPIKIDPSGVSGPTPGQARGPRWRRTSPGFYVPADTPDTVEQRIVEEAKRLPFEGVVGGWAALRLAGCEYFDGLGADGRTPLRVPLVIPANQSLRPGSRSRMIRGTHASDERLDYFGVPCSTPTRATIDQARWSANARAAVVAIDIALAAGLSTGADLAKALDDRRGTKGIAQVRTALLLSDPHTLSPAETQLRLIWVLDARLPRPQCNPPIFDVDGRRLGRPDLLCDELAVAVEFDGATHRTAQQQRVDAIKEHTYRECGLEVVRVVGADLRHPALLAHRLQAAVRRARQANRPRLWTAGSFDT